MAELIPIKITIKPGNVQAGEPAMKYPTGHNPKIIDQSGIGMHYGKTVQIGKGDNEEYAVTAVPQWYLDEFIADATKAGEQDLIQVLTEAEAEQFFTDHIPEPPEVFNDKARIDVLTAKAQAGITLTAEELKAFDPVDPTPGIVNNPVKGFKKKLGANTVKV